MLASINTVWCSKIERGEATGISTDLIGSGRLNIYQPQKEEDYQLLEQLHRSR
jgi:hypothetical protein